MARAAAAARISADRFVGWAAMSGRPHVEARRFPAASLCAKALVFDLKCFEGRAEVFFVRIQTSHVPALASGGITCLVLQDAFMHSCQ